MRALCRCSHRGPRPSFLCMITVRAARASSTRAHCGSCVVGKQLNRYCSRFRARFGIQSSRPLQVRRCPTTVPAAILAPSASPQSGRGRTGARCSCTGSVPPTQTPVGADHPGQRLRPHVGLLARPASRRAADMVRTAAALASSRTSPFSDAQRDTQTLRSRRAAARRAHGQSGYLGECIQGERTALRQAVHSNGTPLSSTVSLAVMRRMEGVVHTFLTLKGPEHGGGPAAARPAPARAASRRRLPRPLIRPHPGGSIGEADQLFLADIERIRTAFAAPVKGRRHGNGAALQLRQLHGGAPLRRERLGERGVLSPAVMATSVTVFALALTTVTAQVAPSVSASGLWLPGRLRHPTVLNPAQKAKERPSRFAPSRA